MRIGDVIRLRPLDSMTSVTANGESDRKMTRGVDSCPEMLNTSGYNGRVLVTGSLC